MPETFAFRIQRALTLLAVAGLVVGVVLWALDQPAALALTAFVVLGIVIAVTAVEMVRDLMEGHWGLDILAMIAMGATLAVGSTSPG
ncbi:hypothetical protein [Nocardioides daphniae]|uniref:hypothetical protein n=1 Tax=Nocardioides daphniae TaxID=402297 RepID=UPI001930EF7B|nr:hypothetical protein [Nocardioides daphniae]